MTNETLPKKKTEMDSEQGFPPQAILLLVIIAIAVVALILKVVGIV